MRIPRIDLRPRTVWLGTLATLAAAGIAVYALVFFDWDYYRTLEGQTYARRLSITVLDGLLATYILFLIALSVAAACLFVERVLSRIRQRSFWGSPLRRRLLLLCGSMLLSAALLESGAAAWRFWLHRNPRLPAVAAQAHDSRPAVGGEPVPEIDAEAKLPTNFNSPGRRPAGDKAPLRILVIGESSGRGEPYHPWLSVGQIVAWRLEKVLPGRAIELDIWAVGGATLASMHHRLTELTYRPDALIVYLGHNEFQGRYAWMRDIPYYLDEIEARSPQVRLLSSVFYLSPCCRLIDETRERQRIVLIPEHTVVRELVDRPVCTAAETAAIVVEFRRRLTAIAEYCQQLGTCPIFVIPPSNDAGYDPSRSALLASAPRTERVAFAHAVAEACAFEQTNPAQAIRLFRELVDWHPEFAETHFRLARLLERTACWDEAKRHYVLAREHDGLPLRCPEVLRQVFHNVAAEHPDVVLIDGPAVLAKQSRHGIVGDEFFHDAQHPNLRGYVAVAAEILKQLQARQSWGWPASLTLPVPDVEACARHFKIDAARWAEICRREIWFFHQSATIRYDRRLRIARAAAYDRAAMAIGVGKDPADADIPGWPLPRKPSTSHRLSPKLSLD